MKPSTELIASGRIWENGQFGLTYVRRKAMEALHFNPNVAAEAEAMEWWLNTKQLHGEEAAIAYLLDEIRETSESSENLGLSNVLNSHSEISTRRRRGALGITGAGKCLVRNACVRLDAESPGNLSSLTLPNVTNDEALTIARVWHEVIRVYNQRMGRALKGAGLTGEIVSVTEVQGKRYLRDGTFALHYHGCFIGRKSRYSEWAVQPELIKEAWRSAIGQYLSKPVESYNWKACENIQRVKKSVSAYLGKYLSKGLGHNPDVDGNVPSAILDVYPSAWYSCTRSLSQRVKAYSFRLTRGAATLLLNTCAQGDWDKYFIWIRPIVLQGDGGIVVIGWTGCLHPDRIEEFNEKQVMNHA